MHGPPGHVSFFLRESELNWGEIIEISPTPEGEHKSFRLTILGACGVLLQGPGLCLQPG